MIDAFHINKKGRQKSGVLFFGIYMWFRIRMNPKSI